MRHSDFLKAVLKPYGFSGIDYTLIMDKGKKKVWKVNLGNYWGALKKMPGSPEKTAFLARASDFLNRAGVKVPAIIPTLRGELFLSFKGDTYVLSRWIAGKQPDYNCHLEQILKALACFHIGSKGFKPVVGEYCRSHLAAWEEDYSAKRERLKQIKTLAGQLQQDRFSQLCLRYIDLFIERINTALIKLGQSCYRDWTNQVKEEICLCHQDFTPKNLRLYSGELYVFDIDAITIDLPARDLRKLANKLFKKNGSNRSLLNTINELYRKFNPLKESEWRVVLIDLYFPHLFYGIVTKYYDRRAKDWTEEKYFERLEDMIKLETEKENMLRDLI